MVDARSMSADAQLELDGVDTGLDLAAVRVTEAGRKQLPARRLEDGAEGLHLALEGVRRRNEVLEGPLEMLLLDFARLRRLRLQGSADEDGLEVGAGEAEQRLLGRHRRHLGHGG